MNVTPTQNFVCQFSETSLLTGSESLAQAILRLFDWLPTQTGEMGEDVFKAAQVIPKFEIADIDDTRSLVFELYGSIKRGYIENISIPLLLAQKALSEYVENPMNSTMVLVLELKTSVELTETLPTKLSRVINTITASLEVVTRESFADECQSNFGKLFYKNVHFVNYLLLNDLQKPQRLNILCTNKHYGTGNFKGTVYETPVGCYVKATDLVDAFATNAEIEFLDRIIKGCETELLFDSGFEHETDYASFNRRKVMALNNANEQLFQTIGEDANLPVIIGRSDNEQLEVRKLVGYAKALFVQTAVDVLPTSELFFKYTLTWAFKQQLRKAFDLYGDRLMYVNFYQQGQYQTGGHYADKPGFIKRIPDNRGNYVKLATRLDIRNTVIVFTDQYLNVLPV